jgi:hypothetical protein
MKKSKFLVVMPFLLALLVAGCKLNGDETSVPSAAFFVVHASPNAPNVDILVNGGGLVQNFAYTADTGYFFVTPGTYNLKVNANGSNSSLIDQNLTLSAGKYYSIFAIDSLSKIKTAIVEDVLSSVGADSVRVRFLQFCPNISALDASFYNANDTLNYTTRSFNDQNSNATLALYKTIKSGTYTLDIKTPPGSGTIYKSFGGINLLSGKSYTIYLKGFDGGTGAQALGIGQVVNVE